MRLSEMGTQKYSDKTYEKARKLRRQGLGYGSIAKKIDVPLGTLRHWVNDISLSEDEKKKLQRNSNKNTSVAECGGKQSVRDFLLRNRPLKCEKCERYDWQGQPITLEVHRKVDKNYSEVNGEEVVLLCPNCHSQTEDWRTH